MSQNETHQFTQFVLWATAALILMGVDVYSRWTQKTQDKMVDIAAPLHSSFKNFRICNYMTASIFIQLFSCLFQSTKCNEFYIITLGDS